MKCPNCNETLLMTDRQGVEIDYCPNCRGVWLDKGELDKLIERSANYRPEVEEPQRGERKYFEQEGKYQQQPYKNDDYYKHKKKKGFLGDLFDFD